MMTNASANKGFTLPEVLVAMVIMSVISLAVYTLISVVNTRSAYILALETRDVLQVEIVRALEDERAIATTRSKDTIFNNCFRLAKSDRGCPGQTEVGVALYNSSGNRIAGPPTAPAYYTIAGNPCQPSANQNSCAIQVTTTVRAQGIPIFWNNKLVETGDIYHELVEVRYAVKIQDNPMFPKNQRLVTGSYVIDTQDQMTTMPQD